jgi:DNA helicase-2/ATP-dependent DNA helicase PcrA
MTDVDKEEENETDFDKVSLMTIHAAKGLEFPYVYIVGLEENLFPSQLSINSRADLEEERRLFYVALTRAEKRATLTYATTRYRFGNIVYAEPSRFLDELDDKYVEYPEIPSSSFNTSTFDKLKGRSFGNKNEEPQFQSNFKPKVAGKKPLLNVNTTKSNSFNQSMDAETIKNLREGSEVEHAQFGKGKIEFIEGEFPNLKATVDFEIGGKRQLLLKFAKLKVLSN